MSDRDAPQSRLEASSLPVPTYIWQAHGTVIVGFGVALIMAVVIYQVFPATWPEFALEFYPKLATVSFNATGGLATFLLMVFVYLGFVAWFNRDMHQLARENVDKIRGPRRSVSQ